MSANPDAEPKSPQEDESLPPRLQPGDCCGGGCAVCVLDGYQEELERWQRQVAEILKRRAEAAGRA